MKTTDHFLKTITHEISDRPLIFTTFTLQVVQKMSEYLNMAFGKIQLAPNPGNLIPIYAAFTCLTGETKMNLRFNPHYSCQG